MRRWVFAAMLAPTLAWASARTPLTNGIYLRPGDDHSLYVRTTFGLLISHDDGCSFRWVCEKALGYGGEFAPKYAIATDGTIFAATFTGLRISRDGGCSWVTATAGPSDPDHLAEAWIDAIDIGPDGHVWLATAESAKPNNLFESADNGATFRPRGLFSRTVWYKSIRVAKSDPKRIYATGYQVAGEAKAHLYRSDDAGATWHELPLADPIRYGGTPIVYVLGIDPTNPDVLYMTSGGASPPSGDRLYRSSDGGHSFREVLHTSDAVRDVVFRKASVMVATLGSGSFEASDGVQFARLPGTTPQLACLAQKADGSLVGCGANWEPDNMALATSATGAAWTKLFRFGELAGPLRCPAGTLAHDACAAQWPALQQQFGAHAPTSCPAGSDLQVIPPPAPPAKPGSGCCDASGELPSGAVVVGVIGMAFALRRRRYRASRQLG